MEKFRGQRKERIQSSLDDIDNLLGTLLVLNMFTFGYCISFLCSVDYDTLYSIDLRFFTDWSDFSSSFFGQPEGTVVLLSALLSFRLWQSFILVAVSLAITVATILGFDSSKCRENEEYFKNWEKVFRYIILIAFILFLVGSMYLFAATAIFSYGANPKYCTGGSTIYSIYAKLDQVYNATSGTLIQGCVEENLRGVGDYITYLSVVIPLLLVSLFLLSIYLPQIMKFCGSKVQIDSTGEDKDNEVVSDTGRSVDEASKQKGVDEIY